MSADEWLDCFFDMIQDIIESMTLPTGDKTLRAFVYAFVITIISTAVSFVPADIRFRFINPWGALIATILLGILAVVEGRGVSDVLKFYRAAQSGARAIKERAKRPGASREDSGHQGSDGEGEEISE